MEIRGLQRFALTLEHCNEGFKAEGIDREINSEEAHLDPRVDDVTDDRKPSSVPNQPFEEEQQHDPDQHTDNPNSFSSSSLRCPTNKERGDGHAPIHHERRDATEIVHKPSTRRREISGSQEQYIRRFQKRRPANTSCCIELGEDRPASSKPDNNKDGLKDLKFGNLYEHEWQQTHQVRPFPLRYQPRVDGPGQYEYQEMNADQPSSSRLDVRITGTVQHEQQEKIPDPYRRIDEEYQFMTTKDPLNDRASPRLNAYVLSTRQNTFYPSPSSWTDSQRSDATTNIMNATGPMNARFPHTKELQRMYAAMRNIDPRMPLCSPLLLALQSRSLVETNVSFKRPDRAQLEYLVTSDLQGNHIRRRKHYLPSANSGEERGTSEVSNQFAQPLRTLLLTLRGLMISVKIDQKSDCGLIALKAGVTKTDARKMRVWALDRKPVLDFKVMAITVSDHRNASAGTVVANAARIAGQSLDGSFMMLKLAQAVQQSTYQTQNTVSHMQLTLLVDNNKSCLHLTLSTMCGTGRIVQGQVYFPLTRPQHISQYIRSAMNRGSSPQDAAPAQVQTLNELRDCHANLGFGNADTRLVTGGPDGMQVYAIQKIPVGEEVAASYGKTYFGNGSGKCLRGTCKADGRNGWPGSRSSTGPSRSSTSMTMFEQEFEMKEPCRSLRMRTPDRGVVALGPNLIKGLGRRQQINQREATNFSGNTPHWLPSHSVGRSLPLAISPTLTHTTLSCPVLYPPALTKVICWGRNREIDDDDEADGDWANAIEWSAPVFLETQYTGYMCDAVTAQQTHALCALKKMGQVAKEQPPPPPPPSSSSSSSSGLRDYPAHKGSASTNTVNSAKLNGDRTGDDRGHWKIYRMTHPTLQRSYNPNPNSDSSSGETLSLHGQGLKPQPIYDLCIRLSVAEIKKPESAIASNAIGSEHKPLNVRPGPSGSELCRTKLQREGSYSGSAYGPRDPKSQSTSHSSHRKQSDAEELYNDTLETDHEILKKRDAHSKDAGIERNEQYSTIRKEREKVKEEKVLLKGSEDITPAMEDMLQISDTAVVSDGSPSLLPTISSQECGDEGR